MTRANEPVLARGMRDHVFVRGLRVHAIIGIHPHERVTPQLIVFDIEAATDGSAAAGDDRIEGAPVDYARLCGIARHLAVEGRFQLVESLAEAIARAACVELRAPWVRVRVGKPDAFADADMVGVCIERTPADYVGAAHDSIAGSQDR
jgi:dihydroneopterin aldolase